MKPENTERLLSIILIAFGLVFVMAGAAASKNTFSKKSRFTEHSAVISRIEQYKGTDGKTSHRAFVEYTVNGTNYNERLGYYSSTMYTGNKIVIYYDPEFPNNIIAGGGAEYFILIIPGFGGIFVIVGAAMAGSRIKKKNDKNKLITFGDQINAKLAEVKINTTYSVNKRHPYQIICSWNDPSSQTTFFYKSRNIWDDPSPAIEAKGITSIPVYIDRYNPKKYYVAIDDLLSTE